MPEVTLAMLCFFAVLWDKERFKKHKKGESRSSCGIVGNTVITHELRRALNILMGVGFMWLLKQGETTLKNREEYKSEKKEK